MRIPVYLILAAAVILCSCAEEPFSPNHDDNLLWRSTGADYISCGSLLAVKTRPSLGGRILSFTIDGNEILCTSGENSGSTFWPSPQNAWLADWPPPGVPDSRTYSVLVDSSLLTMSSETDQSSGLQYTKQIRLRHEDSSLEISYAITNRTAEQKSVAAWEVTRVLPGGLVFFPIETSWQGPSGVSFSRISPVLEDSVVWIKHSGQHNQKLYRDGAEKWIAYARSGFLFVKCYDSNIQVSQFAPQESEIEIYAARDYLELEIQGAYMNLQPGASADLVARWYGRRIPEETDTNAGSPELLYMARELAFR